MQRSPSPEAKPFVGPSFDKFRTSGRKFRTSGRRLSMSGTASSA
jgi:hypothetical protein